MHLNPALTIHDRYHWSGPQPQNRRLCFSQGDSEALK